MPRDLSDYDYLFDALANAGKELVIEQIGSQGKGETAIMEMALVVRNKPSPNEKKPTKPKALHQITIRGGEHVSDAAVRLRSLLIKSGELKK